MLDHLWLDELPTDGVRLEIQQGHDSLAALTVDPGELFRPPRGWTSDAVAQVTRERNIRSVFWSSSLESHLKDGGQGAAAKVVDQSAPGSINSGAGEGGSRAVPGSRAGGG